MISWLKGLFGKKTWAPTSKDLESFDQHWLDQWKANPAGSKIDPQYWKEVHIDYAVDYEKDTPGSCTIDEFIEEQCKDPEFNNEYEQAKLDLKEDLERNSRLLEEARKVREDIRKKLHDEVRNIRPGASVSQHDNSDVLFTSRLITDLQNVVVDDSKRYSSSCSNYSSSSSYDSSSDSSSSC